MICKNCDTIAEGNYCSKCGQKTNIERLNFSYLIRELSGSLFQLEYGFFYTLKELFVAPGRSITAFLNGRRKKYFKPLSYVLILSTLYFLVTLAIDEKTWIGDFISGWSEGSGMYEDNGENSEMMPSILMWFSENHAYSILLLIPVFSLASYLCFKRFDRNYVEHVLINSYITAQQALLYAFFAVVAYISEYQMFEIAPFALSIAYNIFVYYSIFSEGHRVVNILRSIITYVLYLVFSAGAFILIFLISKI